MTRSAKKVSVMGAVFVAALLLASSCSALGGSSSSASSEGDGVEPQDSSSVNSEPVDADFRSFIAAPGQVSLHWKNNEDEPHGQLESVRQELEQQGKTVKLVTNSGIFVPGFIPAGLHIEDGAELQSINLLDGPGNFQLLPNGVFYVADGVAGVLESNAYAASGIQANLAVQSGPMLLADGVIHPEFSETSESTFVRNGVGVTADGQVLFLISTKPVTFWEFASEFIDRGVSNALYLDGSISVMDEPVDGEPLFPNLPLAGILAVSE